MHQTRFIVLLTALTAFFTATEQSSAQEAEADFRRLDADQNTLISWAEAYKVRVGQFMDMDLNMDGILTENEFKGPTRPLSAFDGNEDGDLHLAEFLEGHRSMFDRFDEDANGSLTFEEFEAAQSAAQGN